MKFDDLPDDMILELLYKSLYMINIDKRVYSLFMKNRPYILFRHLGNDKIYPRGLIGSELVEYFNYIFDNNDDIVNLPTECVKAICLNGDHSLFRYLIIEKDFYDKLFFKYAAKYGYLDIFKMVEEIFDHESIIEDDREINEIKELNGIENCLVEACIYGHFEMVKYFIEKGLDPSIRGNAPLYKAIENNHMNIVGYLLEDDRVNPNEYYGALYIATRSDNVDMVKYLLDHPKIILIQKNMKPLKLDENKLIFRLFTEDPRIDISLLIDELLFHSIYISKNHQFIKFIINEYIYIQN